MINRASPLIAALLISILIYMLALHSVTATSPSFVRQEIADPLNDWNLVTEPQLYLWKTQDSNTTKVTVAKNIVDVSQKVLIFRLICPRLALLVMGIY